MLIGLGCESNQIGDLIIKCKENKGEINNIIDTLIMQENNGTKGTVKKGIDIIDKWAEAVNLVTKVDIPISEITLALQCGGSDGFSGLTANPALG